MPSKSVRRRNLVIAALALALLCLGVGAGAFVVLDPPEVTQWDRTTVVTTESLEIDAPCRPERWEAARQFNLTVRVSYHCGGLPPSGNGFVDSWRQSFRSEGEAALAFAGGVRGGKVGFLAGSKEGERMEDQPPLDLSADDVMHARYLVGDAAVGHFIFVRTGRHLLFVNINGYVVPTGSLERVLGERLSRITDGP